MLFKRFKGTKKPGGLFYYINKNFKTEVNLKLKSLGKHLLVEFYGCNKKKLNDLKFIEESMIAAAEEAKSTIVQDVFHKFSPHGISGVVVIAESHLAIHTWPEYGYAAVDLFTCGEKTDPWAAFYYLSEKFEAKIKTTLELKRGTMELPQPKQKIEEKIKAYT